MNHTHKGKGVKWWSSTYEKFTN